MKKLLIAFLLFPGLQSLCQEVQNIRHKTIPFFSDSVQIDTLSIVPGSLRVFLRDGTMLDSSAYSPDYIYATLRWNTHAASYIKASAKGDSITVQYRALSIGFSKPYFHKDATLAGKKLASPFDNPFTYIPDKEKINLFSFQGLNKSGSIARGVTFGNNQDVAVSSSLNLNLSGKLSDKIDILAAVSDENIPVQPDGTTQQLQDFDKVFIQLSDEKSKLVAGDFDLRRPDSYFMNLYKKAQGGNFSTSFTLTDRKKSTMRASAAAAVSKGKYARTLFAGLEGNQGPYKLRGNANETFIIVLSGTEQVYLNGRLLVRGQENDYIIDYNTAEITFTPHNIITKDSRITIEFQYSEKNYARSLFYFNNEYEQQKLKIGFNLFSEQDSKNQPVLQNLSDTDKKILKEAGDDMNLAVVPGSDSVAFTNSEVLYKKTDTAATSGIYTIFMYSSNPDSAHFRVSFSNVGQGNGNYRQKISATNGKVYEWVEPVGGIRQGSYEPVVQLVAPQMKQLYTLSSELSPSTDAKARVEVALSNTRANLFSNKDRTDDIGQAIKATFRHKNLFHQQDKNGWISIAGGDYEYTSSNFSTPENYRSTEFNRDWNLPKGYGRSDEHITGIEAGVYKNTKASMMYRMKSFNRASGYHALSNAMLLSGTLHKFYGKAGASFLQTGGTASNTSYFKHQAELEKRFRFFSTGIKEESEQNKIYSPDSDTLTNSSFSFQELQAYITSPDSAINKFKAEYTVRNDYAASNNSFKQATGAHSIGLSSRLFSTSRNNFSSNTIYRTLEITDPSLTAQQPANTFLNRLEMNLHFIKGLITAGSYYEINTGQEQKKEFSYLEVAKGKGIYAWRDYNGNNIRELNEFEVANFQDEASFVKISIPTNEYLKAYVNQFSQTLSVQPGAILKENKGLKKVIARFADQVYLRSDRKTTDRRTSSAINPFYTAVEDSAVVSTNLVFRNTLSFNRASPKFGMEAGWLDMRNKSLLVSGYESRIQREKNGNVRWNMTRTLGLAGAGRFGAKSNISEFFTERNFRIKYYAAEPVFSYQHDAAFRTELSYRFTHKENMLGLNSERCDIRNTGCEIKYNHVQKGTVSARFSYILIGYNAAENSSLAYEMLDGLKKGKNITWNITLQRNISGGFQLNLYYEGRKPEGLKSIHSANVQARAFF